MSAVRSGLLTLAMTTVGLTSGVMFDWQVTVMPGLGELPDREFVSSFQALDRAIMNPLFIGGAFLGGAAFLVAATVAHRQARGRVRLLAAASALYVVGVVGVTIAGNVPLNERLQDIDVASASSAEVAAARADFEGPWNRLHVVRTGASVLSLALVGLALLARDETVVRGGSAARAARAASR